LLVSGVTLTAASWAYDGTAALWYYTYTNANITTLTVVDFTPNNASVYTTLLARVNPAVTVASGSCKFWANYQPSANIVGDVVITTITT
jgi:hypothetical protein